MIYNIFLLLCALATISHGSNAPVLIWGTSSVPKPALYLVSSNELVELIRPRLSDSLLLIFVENKLSSEDLSYCNSDSGLTCYGNLSTFVPFTYYSNAENPVEVLSNIGDKREHVVVDSEGVSEKNISYNAGKVIFVRFEDNENASRNEKLRNHDGIISKLWHQLSAEGKVIAVYTGLESNNALRRQTREVAEGKAESAPTAPKAESAPAAPAAPTDPAAPAVPTAPRWFLVGEKLLIYYTSIEYAAGNGVTPTPIKITDTNLKETKPTLYDVELIDDKGEKITFQIKFNAGYWSMENLKYKTDSYRISPDIIVPNGFSYYCGITSKYPSSKGELIVKGLQIEAFTAKGPKNTFGDAWHCVGFTSAGIWSGLFVTFMLLGIMTIGILWLMDIKTMDRFDDPKGKTITINAAE